MSDLMTDVIALGCGLVGKFVVTKLCEQGYDCLLYTSDAADD